MACAYGHLEVVKALLAAGADKNAEAQVGACRGNGVIWGKLSQV